MSLSLLLTARLASRHDLVHTLRSDQKLKRRDKERKEAKDREREGRGELVDKSTLFFFFFPLFFQLFSSLAFSPF